MKRSNTKNLYKINPIITFSILIILLFATDEKSYKYVPIGLLVILFLPLICKMNKIKYNRRIDSDISLCDNMSGEAFESYLKHVYEKLGYKVSLTPKTADYGADLIVKRDNIQTVIQAKRYSSHVGVKAIQEVLGAKSYYHANKAIVITNNYFTLNAKKLSYSTGVKLIDRNSLSQLVKGIDV